jgi:hypothetical protein
MMRSMGDLTKAVREPLTMDPLWISSPKLKSEHPNFCTYAR